MSRKHMALSIVKKFSPTVTSVEDSKKDVSIWIVPQDISNKGIKNHQTCAVAQACKRAFKADSAIIGTRTAYIVFDSKAWRFRVPASTSAEIKAFDKGNGFRTGTFILKAPGRRDRLGGGYTGKTHNPSNRQRPSFVKHDRNVRAELYAIKARKS